jgi:hypothetical protein
VRELAGFGQKAPACKVASHTKPTMDDWTSFFLDRNDELTDRVLQLLGISVSDAVLTAAKPIAQIAPAPPESVQTLTIDVDEDEADIPF